MKKLWILESNPTDARLKIEGGVCDTDPSSEDGDRWE